MRECTKEEVKALAAKLIGLSDTGEVGDTLDLLCQVVDAGVDFELLGKDAWLTPLMFMRSKGVNQYAKIFTAINDQREANGLPKLGEKDDRSRYMARYMKFKRDRESRVVDIWNLQFSDEKKLKGPARKKFSAMHAKRWLDAKQAALDKAREIQRRPLTKEENRRIIDEYDDKIDVELDAFEAFMYDEIRKPISQRNPLGFKYQL